MNTNTNADPTLAVENRARTSSTALLRLRNRVISRKHQVQTKVKSNRVRRTHHGDSAVNSRQNGIELNEHTDERDKNRPSDFNAGGGARASQKTLDLKLLYQDRYNGFNLHVLEQLEMLRYSLAHRTKDPEDRSQNTESLGYNNQPSVSVKHRHQDQLRHVKQKLPSFGSKQDECFDLWWDQVVAFFGQYDLSDEDKIKLVNANITGEKRGVLGKLDFDKIKTMDSLHETLSSFFEPKTNWFNKLQHSRQLPNEKFKDFSNRINRYARKAGYSENELLENVCLNLLKEHCVPELKALLKATPYTFKYNDVVQQGEVYEEQLVSEDRDVKHIKRKIESSNAVDQQASEPKIKQS
jgi:hypothetical protein